MLHVIIFRDRKNLQQVKSQAFLLQLLVENDELLLQKSGKEEKITEMVMFIKYSNVIDGPPWCIHKMPHDTVLETISLALLKRVNPKETHGFFACNEDCDRLQGYLLVDTYLRLASKILDNSWTRPGGLEGSTDARDKIFKAFQAFKGACYPSPRTCANVRSVKSHAEVYYKRCKKFIEVIIVAIF